MFKIRVCIIFRLPYLHAVILEVARLGIVVPIAAPREATDNIYFNGILIPKVKQPFIY
jgi:cytochrome P450